MTIAEFISNLISDDTTDIEIIMNSAIYDFVETNDYSQIKQIISEMEEYQLSDLGDKISKPLRECRKICENKKIGATDKYLKKAESFIKALEEIQKIIAEEGKSRKKKQDDSFLNSQNLQVIDELRKSLADARIQINNLKDTVDKEKLENDSKIFNLLINTIAILSIFVAVAFAGVGSESFISLLPISAKNDLTVNVFYLLLAATFIYNLLFLLFYCIFKLVDKLKEKSKLSLWKDCKGFVIIDVIMTVLTVVFFYFVY